MTNISSLYQNKETFYHEMIQHTVPFVFCIVIAKSEWELPRVLYINVASRKKIYKFYVYSPDPSYTIRTDYELIEVIGSMVRWTTLNTECSLQKIESVWNHYENIYITLKDAIKRFVVLHYPV